MPYHSFLSIISEYKNLDIICNARVDSVIYDLPPQKTGRRGRPRKHGARLDIVKDFQLSGEKINGYHIGYRRVFINLFGSSVVHAYTTATNLSSESRRLFFSSIAPYELLCMA